MDINGHKESSKKLIPSQNMKLAIPEVTLAGLEVAQVRAGAEALMTLLKASKNKPLLDVPEPVFMQVCCIKIPKTPTRQIRFILPHSLMTDLTEVCLLVNDLKKGKQVDHEPTIDHFKDLLRANDITVINEVISLRQLKVEYDQYEMKRRLCQRFDMFLADESVSGHIRHLIGGEFIKRKKIPTPVDLKSKKLKDKINKALSKTVMTLHGNGDSFAVTVGHSRQTSEEITANILAVAQGLDEHFPGGWSNIRSLIIKTASTLPVPVYFTFQDSNAVEVPVNQPKRPKAAVPVEGELSTIVGARVTVYPCGKVKVYRDNDQDSDEFSWSDTALSDDDEDVREVLQKKRKVNDETEVKDQPTSEDDEQEEEEEKAVSSSEDEEIGLEKEEETYLSNWHQTVEKKVSKSHSTKEEPKTKKKQKLSHPQVENKERKQKIISMKKAQKQVKGDPILNIKKKSKTMKNLNNKSKLNGV